MSLAVIAFCVAVLSLVFWVDDMRGGERRSDFDDDTGWDTPAAMQRWKDSLTPHQREKLDADIARAVAAMHAELTRRSTV